MKRVLIQVKIPVLVQGVKYVYYPIVIYLICYLPSLLKFIAGKGCDTNLSDSRVHINFGWTAL